MSGLRRCMKGGFEAVELRRYLACLSLYFWGLILVCRLLCPAENHYTIMTHTFSSLGSFDGKHNPHGWWLFSIAMISWGLATMPLTLYIHRRFAAISRWGAALGAFLFLTGCMGLLLAAVFPDAKGTAIGGMRWTDIHGKVALLIPVGFMLGIAWHGLLLLKARFFSSGDIIRFKLGKLAGPYVLWASVAGVATYFLIKWEFVYPEMKAAAEAAGRPIGSHWDAALDTRYSFPLWDNILICTLFIFLVWFSLALPIENTDCRRESISRRVTVHKDEG